jgi:hypothetical protein
LPKMFLWEKIRIRWWIGFVVVIVPKIRDLRFSKRACSKTGKPRIFSVTPLAKIPDAEKFDLERLPPSGPLICLGG